MAATLRDLNTKFTKEQAAQFEAAAQQNQGVSGDLAQGWEAGKSSALGQLNTLAGHGMNALGFDGSARLQAAQENQQLAQEEAQGLTEFKDVDGLRSGLRWAAGALGQSAPVVLPAIGAGLLTGGSLPAALAAGSAAALPFELGGQLQRQEADPTTAGMSSGERLALAAPGAIGAAVAQNVVPAGVAGRILGKGAAGGLKTIIGRAAADVPANAAGEGAAEIARQFSDNLANPNAGYNLEAAKQAAIEGGAMGGVFGAAGAVPHLAHNIVKAPPQLAKDAFNFVGSKAKDAVTAAKDFDFVGAAKGAKDLAKEGYDLSADAAKSGFGAVKDAVEGIDLGGAAKNAMPFMRQQAENAVDATGIDIAGAAENAGPMAKAAARTTADFVGEQARKAKAAVEGFDTKPVKDKATAAYEGFLGVMRGAKDVAKRGLDRIAKGEQYFNPESFAGKTEESLRSALKEDGMLRDNVLTRAYEGMKNSPLLSEASRAQLAAAGQNLKEGTSQRLVAGMARLHERAQRSVSALDEMAKKYAAKKPADGTKQSADYSGVNKAIVDNISSYVRENMPHLDSRRGTDALGDALRRTTLEMLSGKPLSSDALIDLVNVAGDHTATLLDRTRETLKVTDPKQLESFFESASQILQAQDRRNALKNTIAQEYKGGDMSETDLDLALHELISWASDKPTAGAQRKFTDAQMMQGLRENFKNPDKVFDALDAVVVRQENMLAGSPDDAKAAALAEERTARADAADAALAERVQEEGSDAGGEEGRSKLRAGEARGIDGELVGIESRPRLRTFREDGQDGLTMSEEFKPGTNGYPSSQAQALAKARAADPNARWATADELGADHPFVKKQTDRLYEQAALEQGLDGKEADAWVQRELKKYGTAVSELPAGHLALEPWEVSRMKVDKGYYNSPSAVKVGDGENVFDAAKIVAQMRKRSAGKESHMPTTGDRVGEQARLFADGVAALQAHLGKTFDIPDSTVIDATTKMTWGEARKAGRLEIDNTGVGKASVPWRGGKVKVQNDSLIPGRIDRAEKYLTDELHKTYTEAEDLPARFDFNKEEHVDRLVQKYADEQFAQLKKDGGYPDTATAREIYKAARERVRNMTDKLRALTEEHTQDEVGGFHSDATNFNPTEQGFNLTRLTHAQEGKPGSFGGLADNSPRTKRLNELRQNLAAINPAPKSPWAKMHAQTQKRAILNEIRILESQTDSPLGSGKREFDPFGPTFQESKGLDKVTPDGIQEGLHSDLKAKVEGAGKLTPAAESDPRANQGDVRPSKVIAEHIRKLENMPPGKGLETLQRNRQIAEMVKTLEGRGFKLNSDGKWVKAGEPKNAEGSPDPKAVAAKKAAFLEKAASGDAALLEELKASTDVKGLQRAGEALYNRLAERAELVDLSTAVKDVGHAAEAALERGDLAEFDKRMDELFSMELEDPEKYRGALATARAFAGLAEQFRAGKIEPAATEALRQHMVSAAGESTLGKIIDASIDKVESETMRVVLKATRKIAGDVRVRDEALPDKAYGYFDPASQSIALSKDARSFHTLAHEGVHAATMRALNDDPALQAAFVHLLDHAAKHDKVIGMSYGGTNSLEFIAEGLTNPEFRARLKAVPASDRITKFLGDRMANAWDSFVALMRKALGIPKEAESALSQLVSLSGHAMKASVDRTPFTLGEMVGRGVHGGEAVAKRFDQLVRERRFPTELRQDLIKGAAKVRAGEKVPPGIMTGLAALERMSKDKSVDSYDMDRIRQTTDDLDNFTHPIANKLQSVRDSGTANALRTVNDRLRQLAEDPDNAYAMLTKKYSMEGVDPNATGPRVLQFPDRKGERLRAEVQRLADEMSPEDFDTLQNDVLARDPNERRLPTILREDFHEWMRDMYSAVEREDMMSPERLRETEVAFIQEMIDTDGFSPTQLAIAKAFISGDTLKKFSQERVDPNATGPRNFKEAADYIRKVLGPKIKVMVANLPHAGEFIAGVAGKMEDLIRLSMHSLNPMSGAFHESMHGFIKNLSRTKDGEIINVLRQAAESPTVLLALRKKLEGQPDAIKQLADPEERIAYMYQFHRLAEMKLTEPLGLGKPAKGVFNRIAEYIRSILGIWSNDRRALHIMEYFHSGEYAENMGKPDAVRQALLEPGTNARIEWMKKATAPMRNLGEAVAVAGHQRLRDTGIPALNELADMIKRQGTSVGGDQGYLPTSRRERVMRLNAFAEKLGDVTDASVAAALDVLQARDPNAANALKTPEERLAVRAVVSNVRSLLAETKAYMEAAGVEVGDLGPDYFPRVYDLSYISANKEAFMKVLEDHGIKNPETVMQRLMTTEGAEFDVETSRPGMQHLKRRELAKVPDAALAPFMQKDLMRIVDSYVTQATRRAEWARRFDAPDAKGVMVPNKVFNDLLARAAQEGADPKDLDTATKYMMAVDGTLGDTISPEARRLQGNIMVYQNLRLLPLMVFSSVVDPAGIMVRGGTVGDAWHAFKRGIREIPKGFKDNPEHDAATKLAADIGVIESAVLTHALGTSFNQGMVGDTGRAINDKLFKYNLVEQFNTSMRVAATEAAVQFIAKHADGKASPHSARWMAELGLEPGDVKMSPEGKLIVRGNDKVIAAINQWVDGAVLRPDAADKPLWMSDPHYALVAHLKQFAFSFQETILKRVAHEMRNGNMAPAYALASYIPIMIAADATKAMLTGNELGNDEWGLDEYIGHGIERAGLLGVGQFPLDASQFGLTSVFGPTVEQLTQAVDVIGGDKEFAPFVLKSMPANALYRGAFETGDVSEAKFRE